MRLEKDGPSGWKAVTEYSDIVSREHVKKAGFRWDQARKAWFSQSAMAVSTLILKLDPENDEIEDGLAEAVALAASEEQASRDAAIAASRAMDSDIAIPAPDGLEYLPYQRAGVAFLRERLASGGGALLADEMGLGKTIQVIGLINTLLAEAGREQVRALIVAPKIALFNWKAELEKWLIKPHSIAIWSTKSQPEADIVITNYDIVTKLRPLLADPAKPWDLLACDESHALKDQKAQRTKAILGSKSEPPIPARRRIFVTGTPILNRPIELFPVLKSCGVDFATDYFRYAKRYCGGHATRFGFDASGASNLSELQEKLRSSVMVRRLKADVLTELPAKRRQIVTVDPSESVELRKAIREEEKVLKEQEKAEAAARAAVARAERATDKAEYDAAVKSLSAVQLSNFAVIAELRQRTALAKAPFVIDAVTEILESVPDAILVFAHHKEVVARLADGIRAAGHEPAIITGDTSMEERQQAQDDIQQGRKRVFIGSIQACGVAVTLTAASTVIFAEQDWTSGRMVQAEDRAHRIGQQNAVLVQYHVVDGSIDAQMLQKSWSKAFDAAQALDDQVGVPISESVMENPRLVVDVPPLDPVDGYDMAGVSGDFVTNVVTKVIEPNITDGDVLTSVISVSSSVTETTRAVVETPPLTPVSGRGEFKIGSVTDGVTEISEAETAASVVNSVTESVTEIVTGEIQERRTRGRPPAGGIAMTSAERARRYRRKKARSVRVEVFGSAFEQLEKAAAQTGLSAELVVWHALVAASDEYWVRVKASHDSCVSAGCQKSSPSQIGMATTVIAGG